MGILVNKLLNSDDFINSLNYHVQEVILEPTLLSFYAVQCKTHVTCRFTSFFLIAVLTLCKNCRYRYNVINIFTVCTICWCS